MIGKKVIILDQRSEGQTEAMTIGHENFSDLKSQLEVLPKERPIKK